MHMQTDWCEVLTTFWAPNKLLYFLLLTSLTITVWGHLSLIHLRDNSASSCSHLSPVPTPVEDTVCFEGADPKCHCEHRSSGRFQNHGKHPSVATLMWFLAEFSASTSASSEGWRGHLPRACREGPRSGKYLEEGSGTERASCCRAGSLGSVRLPHIFFSSPRSDFKQGSIVQLTWRMTQLHNSVV